MATITITGLNMSFDGNRVVKDLGLEVQDQEFVTFLGPSGCGKTTTLRLLAGFLSPDSGEIHVDGQLLTSSTTTVPPERRNMGMVFQNYAVWPHMSVFENIAFGLKLAKVGKSERGDRVERIMAAVGLEGLGDRRPGQLSGGQQQRVALARSLVVEPSILLLDEPLSNLDAKLRERMRDELKELQQRMGITFVYVTHDQAEAMALSDRVAVFHQGVLQQYGPPRDIYERPSNLFVADFMGSVNKVPGTLIGTVNGVTQVSVGHGRLVRTAVPVNLDSSRKDVIVTIRPEAIGISSGDLTSDDNSLEGTVVDVTFLGKFVDYEVEVDGLPVRVQADRHTVLDVGSKVLLTIPITECVVMQESEPPRLQAPTVPPKDQGPDALGDDLIVGQGTNP